MATGEGSKSCPSVLFSVAVVGTLESVRELGTPYSGEMPSTVPGVKEPELWLKVSVAAEELRARFPEIALLAARLMVPPAWMPRLVSVIERTPVLETDPPVRRARVGIPVGARAAVMLISPVLDPPDAPIRRVPADTLLTSAEVMESLLDTSDPKSITLLSVCGAIVTTPVEEVVLRLAARLSVSPVKVIELGAVTFLSTEMVPVVDVIATAPVLEVTVAVELVAVVMLPEPESVMFPVAWIAAVGATEVPPLMVTVPEDVKVPEPVYAPKGETVMLPAELEFPFIATAVEASTKVPPAPEVVAALIVVAPEVDFNLIVPADMLWGVVRTPPVTETSPVAESALFGVNSVAVFVRPMVMDPGLTGKSSLPNWKLVALCACSKLSAAATNPEDKFAGRIDTSPVVPNMTP